MNSASRLVCCTSPPNASVQLNAKRSGAFALLQSVHPLCNRSHFGGELFYLPAEGQRIQLRDGSISLLCPSEIAVGEKALNIYEKFIVLKKK